MDMHRYSSVLRSLVNQENATAWSQAADKSEFCLGLLDLQQEHPVIMEVLSGTLNNLLSHQSEKLIS